MRKLFSIVAGTAIVVVPVVLLLGLLFNNLSKKSFYPNEGTLKAEGLKSEVKIYSDNFGVPHIFASNDEDIYFALGYMHAQDRLWQMDLTRRVAEGRLSEIFGTTAIEFDKLFRTIGINRAAYNLSNSISPSSKKILISYSNGVNKFIEAHLDNLPVEFDALNYRPDLWKPEHSLMIARLMAWDLNLAWYTEFTLGEIIEKVGLEKTAEIFPDTTISLFKRPSLQNDSLNVIKEISSLNFLLKDFHTSNESYRKFFNINCSHAGSNSWVVSGEKSMTGKPMLANDPHMAFSAPSKWYVVHLKSSALDVYGMSVAGIPAIIIGHNNSIGWGMTNLMNDDCDFFVLEKDPSDQNKYKYKNQIFTLDTLQEKISVKDSDEVVFNVKLSKAGTIISELTKHGFADAEANYQSSSKLVAFKWTGYELSDDIDAFFKLNTALNWNEFKNALKEFNCPAQNFIYADVNGNIGYHAAGKIPIRKSQSNNFYIYSSSSDYEWGGFVDFDKMPSSYNPKEGYIVTANTNPFETMKLDTKDKFYISYLWETTSRFERIDTVLKSRTRLDAQDMRYIQMSYESPYAKKIAAYILNAYKNRNVDDRFLNDALSLMNKWDGTMHANESFGSLFNTFFVFLLKNIFEDELGENIFRDFLTIQNLPYRSTLILLSRGNSLWFDKINTAETESKDEIIRISFEQAIEFLKSKFPDKSVYNWTWGELHKVKHRHPLGYVAALDKSFNIGPFEVGGDQTTVNNSEFSFNNVIRKESFENILGPSMRFIMDFNDIQHSQTIITTGQSGQPLHENYSDQTRLWLYGDFKKTTTSELEMIDRNYKLLTLNP